MPKVKIIENLHTTKTFAIGHCMDSREIKGYIIWILWLSNSVALLEFTFPLDSVCHFQLLLVMDHLRIGSFHGTVEMSALGQYLPISLSSYCNFVNFIQNDFIMFKSQCKIIFDLASIFICAL